MTELYRLFLERHPTEKRRLEDASTLRIIDAEGSKTRGGIGGNQVEDETRLYNELEVTILKASGLPSSSTGVPPSAYVHFQLLGHPDKMTTPKPNDANPVYNEKFTFPMITNEAQLRLLRRSQLQLSVIDMKAEEEEEEGEGLLGEVNIKLDDLAEGKAIVSAFSIKDSSSKRIAEIELSLRWKSPLRIERELGPMALSNTEVEVLLSSFSSSSSSLIAADQSISVDYVAFCRYIDPPKGAQRAMSTLLSFLHNIEEQDVNGGKRSRDVLRLLLSNASKVTEEDFSSVLLRIGADFLPNEITELFQYLDFKKESALSTQEIIDRLELNDEVKVPPLLRDKLQARVSALAAKKQYPSGIFQAMDMWGVGHMTRLVLALASLNLLIMIFA